MLCQQQRARMPATTCMQYPYSPPVTHPRDTPYLKIYQVPCMPQRDTTNIVSSSCLFLPLCFFWRSADTFPFLQFPHSHHHHHHHHLQPGELSSVIMGVTVETTREGDKMTYPRPGDSVTMDYTGTLLDGTVSRCTTVMYLVQ